MLEQIIARKREEVALRSQEVTLEELERRFPRIPPAQFDEALLLPGIRIIAEIKYRSPSHGPFRCQLDPEEIARQYVENGAAALSILTDEPFFGGSVRYLEQISDYLHPSKETDQGAPLRVVPLLRKDFILDRFQVAEARAYGASAFLLIVACLDPGECESLLDYGRDLGLEALVEIHDPYELETAVDSGARVIGVNNRDLKSFEVDINTSFEIAKRLEGEKGFVLIAESGVSERSQVLELQDAGFHGFLVGTAFMDSEKPGVKLKELVNG
jgi:indole-3-glycerol phosphate synthase